MIGLAAVAKELTKEVVKEPAKDIGKEDAKNERLSNTIEKERSGPSEAAEIELPDEIEEESLDVELPDEIQEERFDAELPDEIQEDQSISDLSGSANEGSIDTDMAETELDSETTDVDEMGDPKGGSYKDVFKEGEGDQYEVHHMPADSVSPLERGDGPAIKMEKEDHQQTASYGNSKEAREYRAKQKELIENGKFDEAVQMDIDDIRSKFDDKHDEGISQMLEYLDKLKEEGVIDV